MNIINQPSIVSIVWNFLFMKGNRNLTEEELANTLEIDYQPKHNGNGEEWVIVAEIDSMGKSKNQRKKVYLEESILKIDDLFSDLISQGVTNGLTRGIKLFPKAKEAGINIYNVGKFFYYEDRSCEDCLVIRISPYKEVADSWIEKSKRKKLLDVIKSAIYGNKTQEIAQLEKERFLN